MWQLTWTVIYYFFSFKDEKVYDYNGPRTVQGFKDFVANPPPPNKPEEEIEVEYVDETGANAPGAAHAATDAAAAPKEEL